MESEILLRGSKEGSKGDQQLKHRTTISVSISVSVSSLDVGVGVNVGSESESDSNHTQKRA